MSHGSTEKCEPNFTPLLDLVLQLVMFFMISANFVIEQTSDEVTLPKARAAKALDTATKDIIWLNINSKGQVLLSPLERSSPDEATLDNELQLKRYMVGRAAVEMRKSGTDKPEATIVLRIDAKCPFEKSYPLMKACREAKYSNVQLRAILE